MKRAGRGNRRSAPDNREEERNDMQQVQRNQARTVKADIGRESTVSGGDGLESDDAGETTDDELEDEDLSIGIEDWLERIFDDVDAIGVGEVEREDLIEACQAEAEASEDGARRYVEAVIKAIKEEAAITGNDMITLEEFKECFPAEGEVAPEEEPSPSAPEKAAMLSTLKIFKLTANEGMASLGFISSPPPTAVVKSCTPLSWADEQGIMPGDQLQTLNEMSVSHLSKADFGRLMLERPLRLELVRSPEKARYWQTMRRKLTDISMRQLKKQARRAGVTEDELEDADDDDIPRATIIELIVSRSDLAEEAKVTPEWPSHMDGPPPLMHSSRAVVPLANEGMARRIAETNLRVKAESNVSDLDSKTKKRLTPDTEDHFDDMLGPEDPYYGLNRWFRKTCGSFESALMTTLEDRKTIAEHVGHLMGLIESTPGERNANAFGRELSAAWMEVSETTFIDMLEKLRGVDSVQVRGILVYLEWAVQLDPQVTVDSLLNMWKGIPDGARQKRLRAQRQVRSPKKRAKAPLEQPSQEIAIKEVLPTLPIVPLSDSPLVLNLEDLATSTEQRLSTDPTERAFLQMLEQDHPKKGLLAKLTGMDEDDLDSIDMMLLEDGVDPQEVQEAQRRVIDELCDRLGLFYGSVAEGFRTMVNSSDGKIDMDAFCAYLGFFRKRTPPPDDADDEAPKTEYEDLAVQSFDILDFDKDGLITALDWMHAFSAILGNDDIRLFEIKAERRRDMFRRHAGDHMKNILKMAVVGQSPMIRDFSNEAGEVTSKQLMALVREGLSMDSGEIPDEEIYFLIELLDDETGIIRVTDLMEYAMSDESPEEFDKRRWNEAKQAMEAAADAEAKDEESGEDESEDDEEDYDFEDDEDDEPEQAKAVNSAFAVGLKEIAKAEELVAKVGNADDTVAKSLKSGLSAIAKAQKLASGAMVQDDNDEDEESATDALNRGLVEIAHAQQAVARLAKTQEEFSSGAQDGAATTEGQEVREAREALTVGLTGLLKAQVLASNVGQAEGEEVTAAELQEATGDNFDDVLGFVLRCKLQSKPRKVLKKMEVDGNANEDEEAEYKEEEVEKEEDEEETTTEAKMDELFGLLTRAKLKTKKEKAVVQDTEEEEEKFDEPVKSRADDLLGMLVGTKLKTKTKPRPKPIDPVAADRMQGKLKDAVVGVDPKNIFRMYDIDGSGSLDVAEFKELVRMVLNVSTDELPDEDIDNLIKVLDRDGTGSISIEEAAGFLDQGAAFFENAGEVEEGAGQVEGEESNVQVAAGERRPPRPRKPRKPPIPKEEVEKVLDPKASARLQSALKGATVSVDPQVLFKRFDKEQNGLLDANEFTALIRRALRISPKDLSNEDIDTLIKALDRDGNGISIEEAGDFVNRGHIALKEAPDPEGKDSAWGKAPASDNKAKRKAAKKKKKEEVKQDDHLARAGLDEAVARQIQSRLKAAAYGTDPKILYRRVDKDSHSFS